MIVYWITIFLIVVDIVLLGAIFYFYVTMKGTLTTMQQTTMFQYKKFYDLVVESPFRSLWTTVKNIEDTTCRKNGHVNFNSYSNTYKTMEREDKINDLLQKYSETLRIVVETKNSYVNIVDQLDDIASMAKYPFYKPVVKYTQFFLDNERYFDESEQHEFLDKLRERYPDMETNSLYTLSLSDGRSVVLFPFLIEKAKILLSYLRKTKFENVR